MLDVWKLETAGVLNPPKPYGLKSDDEELRFCPVQCMVAGRT